MFVRAVQRRVLPATSCQRSPRTRRPRTSFAGNPRLRLPSPAGLLVGCAALTGVEAISKRSRLPAKPKSSNAATTCCSSAVIADHAVGDHQPRTLDEHQVPSTHHPTPDRSDCPGDSYVQDTIIGQVSGRSSASSPPGVVIVSVVAGIIVLAATAFSGFPVLSILAVTASFRGNCTPRRPARVRQRASSSSPVPRLSSSSSSPPTSPVSSSSISSASSSRSRLSQMG